ncbi:PREDICTED: protein PLASTID MOVEMENT IMPAIRED 2-like isoform X2 [Populus euphratica]|uniref:Protein PLASTID MOVEMENT IMPAIRED 2-like isoform X2 n=1 Tax=Populus euphratica TaxID=75702 RepID=A0AAJ6UTI2_POPEU|nr:PREDICTED: protein PLASTID MOVEMENT IMPAIRED 2-like isoform X2 [Populus euphratica]
MDRRVFDDRRRIVTVKAAVNMYGERILESSSSSLKKTAQMDLPESSSRAKDLRFSERDLVRYKESRRAAESAKGKAESKLSEAKRKVKDLALQIEQSNLKVKARMRDMDMLKKLIKHEDKALIVGSAESHQYAEVIRELEGVKQELSELKIEMVSVLKEKTRVEKEIASSNSKLSSNMNHGEAIRKKIDEANEEQMPVELARIEALKEFGEIQAQREKEASEFSSAMMESKKKMKNAMEEDSSSKDVESKLAVTLYDANLSQNELKLAKNMDKKGRNDSMKHLGDSFRKGKQLEDSPALKSITEELHAAKKELASIREEGFQFMTSMDIIRNELRHVTEETARLEKEKEKADITAQNLNSKLLRAKSKLETACAVEEKAKSILSSLSVTLEQLKTETELTRKEKKLISEETANIKSEIHKTESQIELTEGKLQAAIRELQAVKTSESLALENLRNVIENTMRSRASATQHSSAITILKFEYEYLTGHTAKAEEIADKKVAAAHAWIEALKASEKEILMKIELAHRDIRGTRVEEEQEIYRTESSLTAKRMVEGELRKWRQTSKKNAEPENQQQPLPRKSMEANGNQTLSRCSKLRNSGSPAVRMTPRSSSITIKKKGTVEPNLAKFFIGKS